MDLSIKFFYNWLQSFSKMAKYKKNISLGNVSNIKIGKKVISSKHKYKQTKRSYTKV